MKGGAHPSPFAALSFPDLKQVLINCWVDSEFFSNRVTKPGLDLPSTFCSIIERLNRSTTVPIETA